jgi:hypothetical protein
MIWNIVWHVALGTFVFSSIALFFIVWKGLVKNPPRGTK